MSARFALLSLVITAVSGTLPTLDIKMVGITRDGNSYGLGIAFAQQTSVPANPLILMIGPGLPVSATSVNGILPVQYQIVQTIGGTLPSFTYSLDLDLV